MPEANPAAPPTLLDILNKTADYFKGRGIENHRLDAQLLLGRVLGMRRLDLYMNFDRPLDASELDRFRELVKRRGQREPLQHLLGEVPFRELALKIDKRALIPRSETELIVDLVRKALIPGRANAVLEIGVGAGPIYLSIVKEITGVELYGVDISRDCLQLTRENARKNGLPEGRLFLGDAFEPLPAEMRWDIIVSNPPYVGRKELPDLAPEVREHDPVQALVGGEEGWEFTSELMEQAFSRLRQPGTFIAEIGAGQYPILKEKSASQAWKSCLSGQDYQNVDRFLILQK